MALKKNKVKVNDISLEIDYDMCVLYATHNVPGDYDMVFYRGVCFVPEEDDFLIEDGNDTHFNTLAEVRAYIDSLTDEQRATIND